MMMMIIKILLLLLILFFLQGAAALCRQTGQHPTVLRDSVTSPAGTTAEGLFVLEKAAVKSAFIEAVHSALKRSQELR